MRLCNQPSAWTRGVRSLCVRPAGHQGRHSWDTPQERERLNRLAIESDRPETDPTTCNTASAWREGTRAYCVLPPRHEGLHSWQR